MLTTVLEQNSVVGHLFHIRLLKLSFWFWLAPKRQCSISAGSESLRKTLRNNEAALFGVWLGRLLILHQCTLVFTPRESPSGEKMVLGCFQRVVIYSHDGIFHPLWVILVLTDSLAKVLLEAGNNFLRHCPFPPILIGSPL